MTAKEIIMDQMSKSVGIIDSLKETMYRGKTFAVVGNRLECSFKTKRGAEGYIKRQSLISYYSESSFEMVNCGQGLEVVEIKESELPALENNFIFWFDCLQNEFRKFNTVDSTINSMKRLVKNIELKSFIQEVAEGLIKNSTISAKNVNFIKELKAGLETKTEEVAATQEINTTVTDQEITVNFNEEKQGIELTFSNKPSEEIRTELKENGFRWHRTKKVWYAKTTNERKIFVNSLIAPVVEETERKDDTILDLTGINYYDIQDLKNMFNDWIKLPTEIQKFILKCNRFNFDNNILLLYKENKIVAEGSFYTKDFKINLENLGAGELFQYDIYSGIKEGTILEPTKEVKKVSFEGVEVQEVKENLEIKTLVPGINKNNTKALNDEEIENRSYLENFKVEYRVNLTVEQYEYFINNLLTDYDFLNHGQVTLITAVGKETLLIYPSRFSYARYLCKIIDNKEYNKQLETIQDDKFYIYNADKKEVITDNRIILNRGINDLTIVTGLTVKELIVEGNNINIYTLKAYTDDLEGYKERLRANICILFGTALDSAIDKINFIERLEKEIKRAGIKAA